MAIVAVAEINLRGPAAFARAAVLAFLLRLNEAQQFVDRGHQLVVGPQNFAGMIESDFGAVQQAVRFGQAVDRFGGEVVSLQAPRR